MVGVFIGWGRNLIFFKFLGALTIKTASFLVQTVEFVFKRSNFNLKGAIRSRHVTTARWLQQ
jgi:hypothetical protein